MKYKCLVLDHDDTIVDSTATIHHPAFVDFLKMIKSDKTVTLTEYFEYGFDPGFHDFCMKIIGLTAEEMDMELEQWKEYVAYHIPHVYPGIKDILWKFKENGGYICVSSHSLSENILRDYKANNLPMPDMIFGWDEEPQNRKPSSYALKQIMRKLDLKPEELVMIDDLKPGKDMADACHIDFIGAGWAHSIPKIENYMRDNCQIYCKCVNDLNKYLFEK